MVRSIFQKMSTCTKPLWSITELSRRVHRVSFDNVGSNGERWILVTADHHVDNVKCRRDIIKRHMDEARERNAPVFLFGDTFCAMQGKWDRRADQNQLRPEHRGNNYLDLLKKEVAEFYDPYADQIALITQGNHETSILDRHQTDLTACLVDRLRNDGERQVCLGGYQGWVEFAMARKGGNHYTKTLCYHHGYGGGGAVTRGMIDNSRTRDQYDADIFVSGHVHWKNADLNVVTSLGRAGKIHKKQQLFLRCGSYKDEDDGWHVAQGRASRPLGGWWIKLTLRRQGAEEWIEMDHMSTST